MEIPPVQKFNWGFQQGIAYANANKGTKITLAADNNFSRLFAVGFSILLISQIFVNIGMSIGLLPIIGIPLPLVSYGGGGLILVFLTLGILQNIRLNP